MTPAPEHDPPENPMIDRALRAAFAAGAPVQEPAPRTADESLPPARTCQIESEIARGGMGVVYRALDPALEREVAIKLLREDLADDAAAVERFLEEARIGGTLQHPGVVPIYALGRTETGRPFFTMKLIEGRTLASMLDARRSPEDDRRRFLSIFESVCRTVAYAHSRGVVHLDLKPANVMVGAFEEVQVVDWGLAAIVAGRNRGSGGRPEEGRIYGTPAYMPPEQARGEIRRLDPRADVFALGAILCEILTGVPPYPGGREARRIDAAEARLDAGLGLLAACAGAPDLAALARRCLVAAPEDRPAGAAEVAAAVAGNFASLETRAREAEIAAAEARVSAGQERRARRLTLSLAGSVLVSVVVGLAVLGWISRERASRRQSVDLRAGAALEEASRLLGRAESSRDLALYGRAVTAAERAQAALASGEGSSELSLHAAALIDRIRAGDAATRLRAEGERAQEAMLSRLEELRVPDEDVDFADGALARDREYSKVFRAGGLDPDALSPETFAAAAEARGVSLDVAAALDEWAAVREEACLLAGAEDLRARALLVDKDPSRTTLRLAIARGTLDDLMRVLEHSDLSHLRPGTFHAFGRALVTRQSGPGPGPVVGFYRIAQRTHPYDYTIAVELARKLFAQGSNSNDEAEHYYRLAQVLHPERVTPYLELGWELDHLEIDMPGAVEQLLRAVELRPSEALSQFCLGHALRRLGDIDGAVAAQRQAARLMPNDARPHKELAMLHGLAGAPDEAIQEFRKVLVIEPDYVQARAEFATALSDHGEVAEGLAQIHLVSVAAPDGRRNWERIEAGILLAHGDYEEAASLLRTNFESDLEAVLPLHERGVRLQDFVRLDALRARCEEAVTRAPAYPDAYCRLGAVLQAQGRCTEALAAFRTGHALSRRQQVWLHPSARWLGQADRLAAVEPRLLEAMTGRLEPRDAGEAFDFAWIASRRGFPDLATRWFTTAFRLEPARASHGLARLEAACAAARTSSRAQALAWLHEDLSLRQDQLRSGGAAAIEARSALGAWRVAGELECVRGESALAQIPPEEGAAWRSAWSAVVSLSAQAKLAGGGAGPDVRR